MAQVAQAGGPSRNAYTGTNLVRNRLQPTPPKDNWAGVEAGYKPSNDVPSARANSVNASPVRQNMQSKKQATQQARKTVPKKQAIPRNATAGRAASSHNVKSTPSFGMAGSSASAARVKPGGGR